VKCDTRDCKGKPKYECPDCGNIYCENCAIHSDFECPFMSHDRPELKQLSGEKKNDI